MDFLMVFSLILLNGIFAMSEMSLVSSKKARLQQLADKGSLGAIKAMSLQDNPAHFLSAIQVGITTISILSGIIGEKSLVEPFKAFLILFGASESFAKSFSGIMVIILLTFLSVIFGEIIPKRMGLVLPEKIASFFAIPMALLTRIGFPIVWILTASSEGLMRFFGLHKIQQTPISNDEIKELMEVGSEAGVFHEAEQQIVANVLNMDDKKAVSIMTHRGELFFIDVAEKFNENIEKIIKCDYSKILIVESGIDNVIGVINIMDILSLIYKKEDFDFKTYMKKPLYLPETVTTTQVLENFKINKTEAAVIVNEYGENIGLVTLVDIMESIVGDVSGLHNEQDSDIIEREDGSLLVDGIVQLDKLGQYLKLDEIQSGESIHTLAGLIFEECGVIPCTGYRLKLLLKEFDLDLEVVDMDKNCIDKVLVKKIEKT
jgi:putative hemolysin